MNEGVATELLLTLGCAGASDAADCSGSSKPRRAGDKSPRRTARKGAINLRDGGLFPPLLTYLREEGGGREERFMGEKRLAVCSICPLTLTHSFVNLPPGRKRSDQETRFNCNISEWGPGKLETGMNI